MFEFGKKYRRGKKTFWFLFVRYAWLLTFVGLGFFYLAWAIFAGPLNTSTANFLAGHPNWYIDTTMLSEWLLLLGVSILILGFLRARVIYSHFKFVLDQHAFNLHQGLFFVRETTIPYQQISNVNILRPYHYRIFGVAKLDILTAADKGPGTMDNHKNSKKLLIPIIDVSVARILSRQLLECASKKQKGEDVDVGFDEIGDEDLDDEELVSEVYEVPESPAPVVAVTEVGDITDDVRSDVSGGLDDDPGDDSEVLEVVEKKQTGKDDLYPTIDLKSL